MSRTTATAVYETLLDCLVFVIDYFSYIEKAELLVKIKISQLCDKLIEGFFGKRTEKTLGRNLQVGDMTDCAFKCMLCHIVNMVTMLVV